MRSTLPRALISALILSSTALAVSACATGRPIVTAPSACSSLIAESLNSDVPPVEMPADDATAGDLWRAFDGQTGRLDQANANRKAIVQTVEGCELRDQAAAGRISAPWWKRPFVRGPAS